MDGCDVSVLVTGARCVVVLGGELDLASAGTVAARLEAIDLDAVRVLDVDLSALRFCDLAGYEVVEALGARARTAGVRFHVLDGAQPPVRRLLSVLAAPGPHV